MNHSENPEIPVGVDNRRRWKRYETETEDVVLTVGRRKRHALIVDESIGGLGLKLTDVRKLSPGKQITVCFRGVDIAAEVKSLREEEDGLYAVGVAWLDTGLTSGAAKANPRKEKATFVCRKGVWLVCHILDQSPNGTSTIVQWDSAYFEVPTSKLMEKTLEQRAEELVFLGNDVTLLAALYRLGDSGTVDKTCEAILDFEFKIDLWK